ncbi:hypothetical protein BDV25DRAFT_144193 [Aspergillus avenaceus]|uniref:Uncharacterized protein n=1 Tax=Aspergillus avenaceus TaxID=36643 RepID=A0A5N6TIL1_ASPAV|nr:hypothetical protein BDV25DRAFT_144193 [Aspergillus avenaceus]
MLGLWRLTRILAIDVEVRRLCQAVEEIADLTSQVRHLRCDTHIPACDHCKQAGVDCDRSFNVRFRSGLDLAGNSDKVFPERAIWPQPPGPLRFHDETTAIKELYYIVTPEASFCQQDTPTHLYCPREEPITRPYPDSELEAFGLEHFLITHHSPNSSLDPPSTGASDPRTLDSPSGQIHDDKYTLDLSVPGKLYSSLLTESQSTPLSKREAILMRNFVDNMALWADITDPQRHFEIEVPLRAVEEPVLRFAIFAFSSRHLNRQKVEDSAEALQYHNRCLQLLIPVLSGPRDNITDTVLAAVAVLRQHEEMDCEDNQFHLTGTTRILNTVSSFGSSGGLGEAAAWLCLREEIYISLTSQQPLRTDLRSFRDSDIFRRNDDFAWASRMVFLLAKVLKHAFGYDLIADPLYLQRIGEEVENWNIQKPRTFEPIQFVPRNSERHKRFPGVWMLLPVHVVGVQYYHIAKIILALTCRSSVPRGYETFRNSRNIEKLVRSHLLTILGLAQSNAKAENTLFTARHSLVAWGWVLRHELDQEGAESLLRDVETRTGWDVSQSIQLLREQWCDDTSDD